MAIDQLPQFMAAIRQVESGNRYDIVGTDHGSRYGVARGAYQIMSGIWGGWASAAGLAGADWRDPAAQDAVARHRMTKYYEQYGDWRLVAAAWFGGEGAANKLRDRGEDAVASTADGFGTTVPQYVQRVVNNFGGSANSTSGNAADRAVTNTAQRTVGGPVTDVLAPPPTSEPQQDNLREDMSNMLDAMSRKIASRPDDFAWMYEAPTEEDADA